MNCASCNARIPPSSSHCYLCGAAQPGRRGAGAASPGGGLSRHGGAPSSSYARWLASSYPRSEGWRIWTSFFLGGLYAPLASAYLVEREEWTAGLRRGALPPAPPSQRGAVVLGLSLALPTFLILVLGAVVSAFDVRLISGEGEAVWTNLRAAYTFTWLNLAVVGFYLLSLVQARTVASRFRELLRELTHGDARAMDVFDAEPWGARLAMLVSLLPALVLGVSAFRMLRVGWDDAQPAFALLYLVVLCGAAWSTSWLNLRPAMRFRAALFQNP